MKTLLSLLGSVIAITPCAPVGAQELVTNPPLSGTFYFIQRTNVPPFGRGGSSYPNPDGTVEDDFFRYETGVAAGSWPTNATNWHLFNPLSTQTSFSTRTNGVVSFTNDPLLQPHAFSGPESGLPDIAPIDNSGNRLTGHIGEFMIFGRALSADERTTVETYFNRRYSLW
jgi:hypothetical protein